MVKGISILSEKRLHLGQKLTVISADIVEAPADAIVHPTNNSLYLGGEVGTLTLLVWFPVYNDYSFSIRLSTS